MCGLFGFSSYSHTPIEGLSILTHSLAEESAIRGTDATGIAYSRSGIQIQKEARAADTMQFHLPPDIRSLIGHTRHSTHGSAKRNCNNHPFAGKVPGCRFALTHNGILSNDAVLRETHHLPKSKIETDSYVAVQLLEQMRELSFTSIRKMAETVSGSYAYAILDDKETLYLVKGDNPISLYHFPEVKLYVYASTEVILYRALVNTPLFSALKKGNLEEIPLKTGTILRINPSGIIETEQFHFEASILKPWWEYGWYEESTTDDEEYRYFLRSVAVFNGIDPGEVDMLLTDGLTLEEVEEYLYER